MDASLSGRRTAMTGFVPYEKGKLRITRNEVSTGTDVVRVRDITAVHVKTPAVGRFVSLLVGVSLVLGAITAFQEGRAGIGAVVGFLGLSFLSVSLFNRKVYVRTHSGKSILVA